MTFLLLLSTQATPAITPFDLARIGAPTQRRSLSVREPCRAESDPDTIVICGKRHDHRLPLPVERVQTDPDARLPGDVPSATAALTPRGRCGIFAGERRCGKAEARRYGYGGGRDPITLLARLGTAVIDPDAE